MTGIVFKAELDKEQFVKYVDFLSWLKNDVETKRNKRYAIATETTDFIIKGEKYELAEQESVGGYLIDSTGEENYYSNSSYSIIEN